MKNIFTLFTLIVALWLTCTFSFAQPDFYLGDANVYAGSAVNVAPNIMFLFDVSDNMTKTGSAIDYEEVGTYIADYEALTDADGNHYESAYISDRVYVQLVAGTANDAKMTVSGTDDGYYVSYEPARIALIENGTWIGRLAKGEFDDKADLTYFTGDMACLMFELSKVALAEWEADHLYSVGDVIEGDSGGTTYKFACTQAGTSNATTEPSWDPDLLEISDGSVKWQPAQSALAVAASVLKMVAQELAGKVNLGVAVLDELNIGARIAQPLISTTTSANLSTFEAAMDELAALEISGNHWQVNEALWDVGTYYNGDTSEAFSSRTKGEVYPAAAQYWCQSNNIILVTSGMDSPLSKTAGAVEDLVTITASGTDDPDGTALDVAKHLYDNLAPSYLDSEGHAFHVKTHVIQLFSELQQLVETAYYGKGLYYSLSSAEELKAIIANLVLGLLEADSSFVAPVVPASPESRAYSGKRIFLGFFKPKNDELWYGNLKKFGLDSDNSITGFDSSDDLVLATDSNGYFLTDTDDNSVIRSFWGTEMDGGKVEFGGVGAVLKARTSARNIYTYTGTSTELTVLSNAFSVANIANISASTLALPIADDIDASDAEKVVEATNLIQFVHGYDVYGEDSSAKRSWIMGDIMHSKPVFLNYERYTFNDANEVDDDVNKGYVFVGANDGMLHAFKDVDGTEAWAFIPPDLLPNLQYLTDSDHHYYFVDNSPFLYVHDKDGDGNIETTGEDHDKAILICGMRRGGGTSTITSGSQGSYFALDVSVPASPKLLWQINSDTSDFAELGQTWSLARVTSMHVNGADKIVAIFAGGYDTNEDLRYGRNQNFPDGTDASTITSSASTGEGSDPSSGTAGAFSPRGRGIYIVEVATVTSTGEDAGDLNTTNSGDLIWKYTYGSTVTSDPLYKTDPSMTYSIPSEALLLDTDFDNYDDHLYVVDAGGRLWRFNVSDAENSDNWSGRIVFEANPTSDDDTDTGRKVFYKPTATLKGDDTFIYFGSGDREHALNTDVIDRLYVVRDRESEEALDDVPWPLSESDLVDVTENELQDDTVSVADKGNILDKLSGDYSDGTKTYYGWYIRLDETDHGGEKVLSSPKVFADIAFFTTYQPASTAPTDDPCVGKLGPGRLYAVKATTGEAAFNFDLSNDTRDEEGDPVVVKGKTDRAFGVKDGLPPEPLVMLDEQGDVTIKVETTDIDPELRIDPIYNIYWMKW